jgi:hypothetical protein
MLPSRPSETIALLAATVATYWIGIFPTGVLQIVQRLG